MKKILVGLFAFGFLFVGLNQADAACRILMRPSPNFCPNGTIETVKDANSCISYKCVSNAIVTPSLKVLSPNGGEVYKAGDKINVKWETENYNGNIAEINLIPIDMKYGTGITFDKDIPNTGNYTVTLPKISENNYWSFGKNFKIEVIIFDQNNEITDLSDNIFTINSNTIDPSIIILSPNGGEEFVQGEYNKISWKGGNGKVQIGLLKDPVSSGSFGIVGWIELNAKPNSSLMWNGKTLKSLDGSIMSAPDLSDDYKIVAVTESNEGNYCLKIYASSPCLSDLSDDTFEIKGIKTSIGSVTQSLDSSNYSNTKVSAGTDGVEVLVVKIKNTGDNDVYLNGIHLGSDYDLNDFIKNTKVINLSNNRQVGQTINNFSDNGSYYYAWASFEGSPVLIPEGESISFKITSDILDDAKDESFIVGSWGLNFKSPGATMSPKKIDGNKITVTNAPTDYSIKVLSPKGGEVYKVGDKINVKWETSNISKTANNIWISLNNSNEAFDLVKTHILNDGIESLIIPNNVPSGKYQVFVTVYGAYTTGDRGGVESASGFITIKEDDSEDKSITLLWPNDGSFEAGETVNVKWSTSNMPNARINIGLLNSNNVYIDEMTDLIDDGQEIFKLPKYIEGKYYFKVSTKNYGDVSDVSDHLFEIYKEDIPSINVLSPKGGEVYKAGDKITVKWKTENISTTEKVIIILDSVYETAAKGDGYNMSGSEGTQNDGLETYILNSNLISGTYNIRVLSKNDTNIVGSNKDDYFIINSANTTSPTINTITQNPRTLKVGVKGDDVKTLQSFLKITADGSFGPVTKAKVIEWQKANNLKADGAFGNASRSKAGL